MKVAIVDYGLANMRSVINAIECLGAEVIIAEQGKDLMGAEKIILPGVGAFDAGMRGLRDRGHEVALNTCVLQEKIPILGICLGFQFLFEGSEEGETSGLGWIPTRLLQFDKSAVKVPHMGWNELELNASSRLFKGLTAPVDVYFVHSFYAPKVQGISNYAAAYCQYGESYVAAVEKDHIFGVQFHPEKSQLTGMKILENFLGIV